MENIIQFPKLGWEFTVNEVAFSIGSFEIRWYGIIIAVGFLLAVIYASFSCRKMNIDVNRLIDVVIVGLIAGIICARLYYVFFSLNRDWYFSNPIEILKIHDGGLGIYGGLIGAVIFGSITAKIRKLKVTAVLDVSCLGFLIGQGIGRWGNFVNQEAFGTATDLPWGMYSEKTEAVVSGSPVHPCFLYESILCFVGFVLLHIFTRKLRRYDGQTFLLYIVWYGVCRFFIEGIRTDSLYIPNTSLKVSQVVAAACVIVGVILLIVFRHRTSLSGCGSRKVMEGIGLAEKDENAEAEDGFSTIFGDLKPEEIFPENNKEDALDDENLELDDTEDIANIRDVEGSEDEAPSEVGPAEENDLIESDNEDKNKALTVEEENPANPTDEKKTEEED